MKFTRETLREIIRFGLVGVIATALHYGAYLLLLHALPNWLAYTLGYIISFLVNFLLSNYFTFRTQPSVKKAAGFGLSHLINYILHMTFLELFLWAGLPEKIAPIPVFLIVIPINFLLVRFFLKKD